MAYVRKMWHGMTKGIAGLTLKFRLTPKTTFLHKSLGSRKSNDHLITVEDVQRFQWTTPLYRFLPDNPQAPYRNRTDKKISACFKEEGFARIENENNANKMGEKFSKETDFLSKKAAQKSVFVTDDLRWKWSLYLLIDDKCFVFWSLSGIFCRIRKPLRSVLVR